MPRDQSSGPRRWVVPRPGPDGKPLGILTVEVVAASHYDAQLDRALEAEREVERLKSEIAQVIGR